MDDRILIPQAPITVDERRAAIERRLRERYPDLEIRVDLAGDVYSIVASCAIGSFTEEVSVYETTNHTVHELRDYFVQLADDYSEHLGREEAKDERETDRWIAEHEAYIGAREDSLEFSRSMSDEDYRA